MLANHTGWQLLMLWHWQLYIKQCPKQEKSHWDLCLWPNRKLLNGQITGNERFAMTLWGWAYINRSRIVPAKRDGSCLPNFFLPLLIRETVDIASSIAKYQKHWSSSHLWEASSHLYKNTNKWMTFDIWQPVETGMPKIHCLHVVLWESDQHSIAANGKCQAICFHQGISEDNSAFRRCHAPSLLILLFLSPNKIWQLVVC